MWSSRNQNGTRDEMHLTSKFVLLCCFKLHRDQSISFNLSNVGKCCIDLSSYGTVLKVKKGNENRLVVIRSSINRWRSNGKEMYQTRMMPREESVFDY